MPLMSCFECGREISEYADVCPGCGYVLKSRPWENASDEHIEYWLWKHTGWKWGVIGRVSTVPGRALVLSEDMLEFRPFEDGEEDVVSWETSALRRYLNGPFFSDLPASVRERVVRINHGNRFSVGGVRDSDCDRVFLLSMEEVEIYLKGRDTCVDLAECHEDASAEQYEEDRAVSPLEAWKDDSRQYSKSLHDEWEEEYDSVLKSEGHYKTARADWYMDRYEEEKSRLEEHWRNCGWWLRTMSDDPSKALLTDHGMRRTKGIKTNGYGSSSASECFGVRVALYVDISSRANPDLDTAVAKPDLTEDIPF